MTMCGWCFAEDQETQPAEIDGEPNVQCVDRRGCARRQRQQIAADVAQEVREVAEGLAAARQDVRDGEAELAEKIRSALTEGVSVTAIARAARLSRERVYQIRDGRR